MTLTHPRSRSRTAFSLIELMVAIGITSLMMLLIGRIVSETQQAVSRGVELGEVISLSRSAGAQMQADADAMFGPHGTAPGTRGPTTTGAEIRSAGANAYAPGDTFTLPDVKDGAARSPDVETGGVMVIAKHVVFNQPFDPADLIIDPNTGDPVTRRAVLSDQLAFIRERLGDAALTPASGESYLTATDLRAAPFERVWYGHLSKTAADGRYVPPTPGDPTRNGEPEPMLWLLGRHATLLFDEPENVRPEDSARGLDDPESIPPVHAEGIRAGATVRNVTGVPAAIPEVLRSGLTDSAFWGLSEPSGAYPQPADPRPNSVRPNRIHRNGAVVGGWRPNYVLPGSLNTLAAKGANERLWSDLSFDDYRVRALQQMVFASPSSSGRLAANPYPAGADYEPWQLAQSHAILAEGCSDFVVEFAADTDGNGEVDTVTREESNNVYGDDRAEGEIKWYTDDRTFNSNGSTGTPAGRTFDASSPLTFPLPGLPANVPGRTGDFSSDYPAPLQEQKEYRVQVYEPESVALASVPTRDFSSAFVWRHDAFDPDSAADGNDEFYCNWPYLLRIRYRLHDGAGRLAGPDSAQGIWFEQVLRVDRPYPD